MPCLPVCGWENDECTGDGSEKRVVSKFRVRLESAIVVDRMNSFRMKVRRGMSGSKYAVMLGKMCVVQPKSD